jgi:hypothetical protein
MSKLLLASRQNCPSCDHHSGEQGGIGFIAPWLLKLSGLNVENRIQNLNICAECGTGWFCFAYPDEILSSLYSDYRGKKYFNIRNHWDWSYSQELNNGLASSKSWMNWRKSCVETLLESVNFSNHEIRTCVDIGGGEGGVIPDFPNAEKYVVDSNKNLRLPPDITQLTEIEDMRKITPDFVMCCGLLEHLNEPSNFLQQLVANSGVNSVFYFEVPFGVPKVKSTLLISNSILSLLASNSFAWNFALKLDKKIKKYTHWNLLPLKISEHINFFTERGLKKLVESVDLEVLGIKIFHTNFALPDSVNVGFEYGIQVIAKQSGKTKK